MEGDADCGPGLGDTDMLTEFNQDEDGFEVVAAPTVYEYLVASEPSFLRGIPTQKVIATSESEAITNFSAWSLKWGRPAPKIISIRRGPVYGRHVSR